MSEIWFQHVVEPQTVGYVVLMPDRDQLQARQLQMAVDAPAWNRSSRQQAVVDAAARWKLEFPTPDQIEAAIEAALVPKLLTDDGRELSIASLLTSDHPELLRAVIEAALLSVKEID